MQGRVGPGGRREGQQQQDRAPRDQEHARPEAAPSVRSVTTLPPRVSRSAAARTPSAATARPAPAALVDVAMRTSSRSPAVISRAPIARCQLSPGVEWICSWTMNSAPVLRNATGSTAVEPRPFVHAAAASQLERPRGEQNVSPQKVDQHVVHDVGEHRRGPRADATEHQPPGDYQRPLIAPVARRDRPAASTPRARSRGTTRPESSARARFECGAASPAAPPIQEPRPDQRNQQWRLVEVVADMRRGEAVELEASRDRPDDPGSDQRKPDHQAGSDQRPAPAVNDWVDNVRCSGAPSRRGRTGRWRSAVDR